MSAAIELVAGRYRLDPTRTACRFAVTHLFGMGTVRGSVPVVAGSVVVADGAARVTAELDAGALATGNARRDKDLRSARFLDVDRHPRWEFAGDLVGERIAGTLTVRGQAASCALAVLAVTRAHGQVEVRASAVLDRRAFGVTAGRGLIGREVAVELAVRLAPE